MFSWAYCKNSDKFFQFYSDIFSFSTFLLSIYMLYYMYLFRPVCRHKKSGRHRQISGKIFLLTFAGNKIYLL